MATKKTAGKIVQSSCPRAGRKAPAFSAPASNGKTVKLSDFTGQVIALYFYPKDNTSDAQKRLAASGMRIWP